MGNRAFQKNETSFFLIYIQNTLIRIQSCINIAQQVIFSRKIITTIANGCKRNSQWCIIQFLGLCSSVYYIPGYQTAAAPLGKNRYFNSSEPKVKSCCLINGNSPDFIPNKANSKTRAIVFQNFYGHYCRTRQPCPT